MKILALLRRSPWSIRIAMLFVLMFVAMALFSPLMATMDPDKQDLLNRLSRPGTAGTTDGIHIMGTDHLGRDVWSRVVYGSRVSISFAVLGTIVGLTIGTAIGLIAGYLGGRTEGALMFLVDTQQSLPFIILCMVGIAIFGNSISLLIPLVGLAGWEGYARYARAGALSARTSQYVLASQALGATNGQLVLRHVLPNTVAPIIVLATLNATGVILLESTLSFLGLGVQPPTPTWGNMISEGRQYLGSAWWIAVMPGLAMITITLSITLIGDWVRDELDPKNAKR